jgi:hypothetical protein
VIPPDDAMQTRTVCLWLSMQAVISFRAVPRVLRVFDAWGSAWPSWVPHFSSVINWTLRLGLALLDHVKPMDKPWLAIIDYSLAIGIQKVLVVLRVPMEALAQRGAAVTLEDCECLGVRVSERTDGETVAKALTEIFATAGAPVAVIKDGGRDLSKGVALWKERAGKPAVWTIDDLGHVLANALKAQFDNTLAFQRFVAISHRGAARLRQTPLAFLMPPKLRTQGRFQGITRLGQWAEKILKALAGSGCAQNDSLRAKLRSAMTGLASLRPFIERFALTAHRAAEVLAILKNQGLHPDTYRQCCQLTEQLPPRCKVKKRLLNWLQRQLHIQRQLGIQPLLVSSDIIESLFGKFKHVTARGTQAEMNRTVLVLPTLCGKYDGQVIAHALAHTSHRDLQEWEKQNIPATLRQRRHAFFHANEGPKTGKAIARI